MIWLFDWTDSCTEIYNIGVRRCVSCESLAFNPKDNHLYNVTVYYTEYWNEDEDDIDVEIERIDELSQEDWDEWYLPMFEDYVSNRDEIIPIIKKTYNLR